MFLSERVLHPSKASLPKFCCIREAGWTHLYSIHIVSLLCNFINFLQVGQFYISATSPSLKLNSDLIGFFRPWYDRCMYHVCLLSLHTFSNSLLACFPFKAKGQLASVTLACTADRCHPPKLPSDFPSKRKSLKLQMKIFQGAKMYFSRAQTRPASPLVASVNTADCLQTLAKY